MISVVLRIVRPPNWCFALALDIMFNDVCIPLVTQCLFTPLLYPEGLLILQDHINRVGDVAADGLMEGMRPTMIRPKA